MQPTNIRMDQSIAQDDISRLQSLYQLQRDQFRIPWTSPSQYHTTNNHIYIYFGHALNHQMINHIHYNNLTMMRTLQMITSTPSNIEAVFLGNFPASLAAIGAAVKPPTTRDRIVCQ